MTFHRALTLTPALTLPLTLTPERLTPERLTPASLTKALEHPFVLEAPGTRCARDASGVFDTEIISKMRCFAEVRG